MNNNSKDKQAAIRSVLVIRPDNLGDMVLFSGALRHIREKYPNAKIVLCIKKAIINLLEHCPYIDKIITWESLTNPLFSIHKPISKIKGLWRINRMLRQLRCRLLKSDIILLPVRSPNSGPTGMHQILKLIPAKEKIGLRGDFCNQSTGEDNKAESHYTRRLMLAKNQKNDHEIIITREFLKFTGIEIGSQSLWPEFWTDDLDRICAENIMPLKMPGITILAIAPGVTSNQGKFYPGEKYAQALSLLQDSLFHIVIFGNKAEKIVCDDVASALKGLKHIKAIINLAGKTTIRQLIECLRRCDLLISQETGSLHIGVGLRKPTIGILGGGHYGRFYPWGDREINRVVNYLMDCYWCNWECCYSKARCIEQIKPHLIADEMKKALNIMNSEKRREHIPILVSY